MTHTNLMAGKQSPLPADARLGPGHPGAWLIAALRVAAYLFVLALGLVAGGFGIFATHVSEMRTPPVPGAADAIVVLTGGQSRLDAAMDLLRSGKGKRLLISGVHPSAGRDQLRRAMGADSALFACCVDIDRAALDTIGNAAESAKWVKHHGYRKVIVVTNNYHMPRSLLEMERLIDGVELVPYPVVNTDLHAGRWLLEPEALRVLITEYTKYLASLIRTVLPNAAGHASVASAAASWN